MKSSDIGDDVSAAKSSVTVCPACRGRTTYLWEMQVLSRYNVRYFTCKKCGAIHTEPPYWLGEAYSDVITRSDTGLLKRNFRYVIQTAGILRLLGLSHVRGADFGGGYGVFTRAMRDLGFEWFWDDPYCRNLFAGDFTVSRQSGRMVVVTAFEVLEHLSDPDILFRTARDWGATYIIASTVTHNGSPPQTWGYLSPHSGQHVTLYSHTALRALARRHSMEVYSSGPLHVFTPPGARKRPLRLAFVCGLSDIAWRSVTGQSLTVADSQAAIDKAEEAAKQ